MSKEKLQRIKASARQFIRDRFDPRDPAVIFVCVILLSLLVLITVCLIVGDGYFSNIFFRLCGDLFMDHFNSIRDAAQGSAVYTERGVIYPPMANLIYLVLSRIAPDGFNSTPFEYRQTWMYYPASILIVSLTVALLAMLVYAVFREKLRRPRFISCTFGMLAVFNAATLYTLERGNIVVLALVALAGFAFTYNSESRAMRELGLISLAFATSIKLYPAMFFLLLLANRRYRELLRGICYTLALFIIPSFFFGGPICLWWLVENIFSFSSDKSFTIGAVTILADLINIPYGVLSALAYLWCFICLGSFVASVLMREESWKIWAKGITLTLVAPPLTALYSWSFFLIPITLLCNKYPRLDKETALPFIMMTLPFVFLPFRINYFLDASSLAVYVGTALISIMFAADTLVSLRTQRLKKKRTKIRTENF